MGRFVGYLKQPALRAAMEGIDDVALLQTAFVMEGKERLDEILALLPGDRMRTIVLAAEKRDMWPETLDLLANVSPERRAELVDIAVNEGLEQTLPSLIAAVEATGAWESGLRLLAELPEGLKAQLAQTASELDGTGRSRALEEARAHRLLEQLGPIGEALKS
jgi:hypothetical protein